MELPNELVKFKGEENINTTYNKIVLLNEIKLEKDNKMSKINFKDKFKNSEFLSDKAKKINLDLVKEVEKKAKKDKHKLANKLNQDSKEVVEDIFLQYIPVGN